MKRKIIFPPIESADENGLVAIGGDLETDTLLEAYRQGIFPWPVSDSPQQRDIPLTWFTPDPRGILEYCDLHLSGSFLKFLKKNPYQVSFNTHFSEVITACSNIPRKNQHGTWLTPKMIEAFIRLFEAQNAYSVEVWENDLLIGGLYGVMIGDYISGESMFSLKTNASKLALYKLMEKLKNRNITWIDTQMVTPVVHQFGGKYIARSDFISKLNKAVHSKRSRLELF